MSTYIDNMKKTIGTKKSVKAKIDTKLNNTKELITNYTELAAKHQETSAKYAGELLRMEAVLAGAEETQSELDEVAKELGEFDTKYPYVPRFGDGGVDNSEAFEAREILLSGLNGKYSDLTTRMKQSEKLLNKIYFNR